jgi:hypothetical protein
MLKHFSCFLFETWDETVKDSLNARFCSLREKCAQQRSKNQSEETAFAKELLAKLPSVLPARGVMPHFQYSQQQNASTQHPSV